MFKSVIAKLFQSNDAQDGFSAEYHHYAADAYPSNHTYKIKQKKLFPSRQLSKRYHKIKALLPKPLTRFLDIGSSKGYFVFAASEQPTCMHSLGIDINEYDITFCRQLKQYLNNERTQFEQLKLHELSANIQNFGGAFQVVLVINLYQYLFFGSDRSECRYLDHDKIFSYLRSICTERVIFNNRVQLEAVQNERWAQLAGEKAQSYTEENIKLAASRYFTLTEHGLIGRYPLWTLDVKK